MSDSAAITTTTTVRTHYGAVTGKSHGDHRTFLGVPYAAAPVGAKRFAAPESPPPWSDCFDATEWGPTAPQPEMAQAMGPLNMTPYFGPGWIRGENYLTVSIWTPTHGQGWPVMVCLPGGGLVAGGASAPIHNGASFARDGVVLVVVQHRLGIPGFLSVPEAPDNRGLLDVMAALRWVQAEIAAFGGDPSNVTLCGESAGAILATSVLATPGASDLIRRVIIQSGTGSGAFTPAQGYAVTDAAAKALGIPPTAAAFSAVPDERFLDVLPHLSLPDLEIDGAFDPLVGLNPFSVILDHQPGDRVAAGVGADIDLLIGTNAEEGRLYVVPSGELERTTAEDLDQLAARVHREPARLTRAYRSRYPTATAGDLRALILGDALFGVSSRKLALAHAGQSGGPTYRYEFGWRSSALGGRLGATHTVELPFVFATTDLPMLRGGGNLLGTQDPPRHLVAAIHAAWVDFATSGDPGWPSFDREAAATQTWNTTSGMVEDPDGWIQEVWR